MGLTDCSRIAAVSTDNDEKSNGGDYFGKWTNFADAKEDFEASMRKWKPIKSRRRTGTEEGRDAKERSHLLCSRVNSLEV